MTENKDLKEAGYRVITIVLCPTKNGRPYKRPRRHSFGRLEFCVEFLGSVEELELLFTRSVVLSGSIFFFMDDERAQESLQRARLHVSYFASDDHCATLPLEKMFEVGTVRKVQEHNDFRATHMGLDGTFILDAEQTPKFSSPGRVFVYQNSC
jgi:hypothetical protein